MRTGAEEVSKNDEVLHWYDFLCPFSYIDQSRTAVLTSHGFNVIELPFQVYPDIRFSGVSVGRCFGSMYSNLEREAKEAGLALNWPSTLPDTRLALAAAEWVRQNQPDHFRPFYKDLFAAHFVFGDDLGNVTVIDRHAKNQGICLEALHIALADGTALRAVKDAEALGRRYKLRCTPACLVGQRLISGLLSTPDFCRLAAAAKQLIL
jgi:predicted DsbA family dithiol-disulfide isomerase